MQGRARPACARLDGRPSRTPLRPRRSHSPWALSNADLFEAAYKPVHGSAGSVAWLKEQLGLLRMEAHSHTFGSAVDPRTQRRAPCTNVHGILRADRGDAKESILLVTPVQLSGGRTGGARRRRRTAAAAPPALNPHPSAPPRRPRCRAVAPAPTCRRAAAAPADFQQPADAAAFALALGHALLAHLGRVPWLAKDVIWVVPDASCGLVASMEAWVSTYQSVVSSLPRLPQDALLQQPGRPAAAGARAAGPGRHRRRRPAAPAHPSRRRPAARATRPLAAPACCSRRWCWRCPPPPSTLWSCQWRAMMASCPSWTCTGCSSTTAPRGPACPCC